MRCTLWKRFCPWSPMWRLIALLLAGSLVESLPAQAAPRVAVSVLPLHSLVAGVMEGVGAPELLLPAGASPHSLQLRPSQRRLLAEADLVLWFGPELELFLVRALASVDAHHAMFDSPALMTLPAREIGAWAHKSEEEAPGHGHEDEHSHSGTIDPHVWLDPQNAARLVDHIAMLLMRVDPDNGAEYDENRNAVSARLGRLEERLSAQLREVAGQPYLVFHDAYQYFERRFGLRPLAAVSIDPARRSGARRVQQVQALIREHSVRCLFAEPQFHAPLLATLIEGSNTQIGQLDPLGAQLVPGPEAYFSLLDGLAVSLINCLRS